MEHKSKIGTVGIGFIASGVVRMLLKSNDIMPSKILTRRELDINLLLRVPFFYIHNPLKS